MRLKHLILILCLGMSTSGFGQMVETIAGVLDSTGIKDTVALKSTFNNPHGIAVGPSGAIYLADRYNHLIRKIDSNGVVSTYAGSGVKGHQDGPADQAMFSEPWDLEVDEEGNVFVADTRNNRIRKISTDGTVTTFAGNGSFGFTDHTVGIAASFGNPTGITIDSSGVLYVADHLTHLIRRISPQGAVTTLAGKKHGFPSNHGAEDGFGSEASFYRPYGLEIAPDGYIYVADEWNHLIRRVSTTGFVETVAGTGVIGSQDGEDASFNYPWDVIVDPSGNVFVADGYNYVIRKIDAQGVTSTFVGQAGNFGAQDGYGGEASFDGATGLAFAEGYMSFYVGDAYNQLVRRVLIDIPTPAAGWFIDNQEADSICLGETVRLKTNDLGFEYVEFFINGELWQSSSQLEFEFQPDEAQTYVVQVRGVAQGRYSPFSTPATLEVLPLPIADFSVAQRKLEKGASVWFENESSSGTYAWNFGDPGSGSLNVSTVVNPFHTYNFKGKYDVFLRVIGIGGCTSEVTKFEYIEITEPVLSELFNNPDWEESEGGVDPEEPTDTTVVPTEPTEEVEEFFIPNGFTPNGDGLNDVFRIHVSDISFLHMMIFNQWGEMVFEAVDPHAEWNGYYKGKLADMATYVYVLRLARGANEIERFTGQVTLFR